MKWTINLNVDEKAIKENIENEIPNYELPRGLKVEDVVNLAVKTETNKQMINEVFEKAFDKAGYKKVVDTKFKQTYYLLSPNYKEGNPLQVRLVHKTLMNDMKSYNIPVELIVWCYKEVKGLENDWGFVKEPKDFQVDLITMLGSRGVISYIEDGKDYTNIKVERMGKALHIDGVRSFTTIYSIHQGMFNVFYTIIYDGVTDTYQLVESLTLTPDLMVALADIYEYYLQTKDEAQKQQDDINDEMIELQIAQLKKQISLLETQLSYNQAKKEEN